MEALRSTIGILATITGGLLYSYYVILKLPKGFARVLALLPVIGTYIVLPFQVSTLHSRGIIGFLLAWISSFKLMMLCFDVGPLAKPWPKQSLVRFMAVASFPIKVSDTNNSGTKPGKPILTNVIVKGFLLSGVIYTYSFTNRISQSLILVLYGVHMYLALDIILVTLAAVAKCCLGVELEPQFNKPYLASSLQDFWGKRWNLIVTNILRPSVYDPVLYFCWRAHSKGNRETGKPPVWARGLALFSAFFVSGFMHELMFFYITEVKASGEVMLFFMLHGLCTAIEVALRRRLPPHIKLPKFIAIPCTLIFIYKTGFWLFFPPITRNGTDVKAISEYRVLLRWLFPAIG